MGLLRPWYPEFYNAARSNAERIAYSKKEMLKDILITTPLTAVAIGLLAGCVVALFTTGVFVPIVAAASFAAVVLAVGAVASFVGHIKRVEHLN